MRYRQITPDERYTLGVLRKQGFSKAAMARALGRHRSTIGREFRRNASRFDGYYLSALAQAIGEVWHTPRAERRGCATLRRQ